MPQKASSRLRSLVLASLFVALDLLFTRAFCIYIMGGAERISLQFLATSVCGWALGPWWGAASAAAGDLIGALIGSSGFSFFPGFTLTAALRGFTYGWLLHRRPVTFPRSLLANSTVGVLLGLLLNSFWLTFYMGKSFWVWTIAKAPVRLLLIPLQAYLIFLVLRALQKSGFGDTKSIAHRANHAESIHAAASTEDNMKELRLTIPAFAEGDWIPTENTARGSDLSPEMRLSGIEEAAVCLAITLDDVDHPLFPGYNHWIIWNVPVMETIPAAIPKGEHPQTLSPAVQGLAYGKHCYKGPKPPLHWLHRYRYTVYALDSMLSIPPESDRETFLKAAEGHILQKAVYSGKYQTGHR